MHRPLTHDQRVQQNRQYFKKLLNQATPHPCPLNTKLTTNPFLRNQDKFQFITYHLNQYNKRIQKSLVHDKYEILSYQKLYSMISDLAQIQTRQDQLKALGEVYDWYKEQERLVGQRRDQGDIRYEMTKGYRKFLSGGQGDNSGNDNSQDNEKLTDPLQQEIPSQLIARIMQPYYFSNRTSHKQLEVPLRRLNQYKRKVINIAPFIDGKQPAKPQRVLYPMPPKYEPKEQEEQVKEQGQGQGDNVLGEGGVDGQVPIEGEEKKEEDNAAGQLEQDLGGFGEEPQEPQEQQPAEDTEDKLAPRNKLYTAAVTAITQHQKPYNGQYMHFKGRQNTSQRSLEMRYLRLQQQILTQQRQDKLNIDLASERARKKSKVTKDIQKKLQDMMHKPVYKFSPQQHGHQQKLSHNDQVRFGFTTTVRQKPKLPEIGLGNQTVSLLPKIRDDSFSQKSIRRQRIQSLKSKFSKLLNLSQYEQRETAASMCQYSARRRGLSQIIKAHSKSKQRLSQLDQVTRIKQKLTRNKIGVNIRALSQGLCLPDSEQQEVMENMWPNKELPSNPFMVETKKKKKKKK